MRQSVGNNDLTDLYQSHSSLKTFSDLRCSWASPSPWGLAPAAPKLQQGKLCCNYFSFPCEPIRIAFGLARPPEPIFLLRSHQKQFPPDNMAAGIIYANKSFHTDKVATQGGGVKVIQTSS